MDAKHYLLMKKEKKEKTASFKIKNLDGFKMKPLNQIQYEGIKVSKIKLINRDFINQLLKRKVKRKLEMYLNYLITYIDDGGEDGTTDLRHALNDLTRYKETLRNKYHKFLEEKYLELLFKKIAVLEEELKTRILYTEMYMPSDVYEVEEKKGKSR